MQVKFLGAAVNTDTNSNIYQVSGVDVAVINASNQTATEPSHLVVGRRYKIINNGGNVGAKNTILTAMGADATPAANEVFRLKSLPSAANVTTLNNGTPATFQRLSDVDHNKSNIDNATCVLVSGSSAEKKSIMVLDNSATPVSGFRGNIVASFTIPRYAMVKLLKEPDQMLYAADSIAGHGAVNTGVTFAKIAITD